MKMKINQALKKSGFLFSLLIILLIFTNTVQAASQEQDVNIYFFWGEGCPHCEIARPALEEMANSDPRINLFEFEVYKEPENLELLREFAATYGFEPTGVPTIFIGANYWVGYSDTIQTEIETYLNDCLSGVWLCPDPGSKILGEDHPQEEALPTKTATTEDEGTENGDPGKTLTLPLIGSINLSGQSLLISTLIISFVDGFNPCSLWVLSILLSITLQSGSRKRVLIVGGVFLLVTAALYGLFIAGVFSVLRIISFMGWIRVVVALIALGFGLVNIKDYFWFQQGVSFTIGKDKKPGIYKRMRGILENSNSTWRLIGATVVFAAGIALVELSCTAGFPVIWSNLLASQQVTTLTFVLLLLLYMAIYLLDELGIFLAAVFTLRSSKLEEKHGRVLKLIGGMLMLTLSVVMLIDPNLMNDITSTIIIFGIALGLTGLVLLIHRFILPKFNINIGSEKW